MESRGRPWKTKEYHGKTHTQKTYGKTSWADHLLKYDNAQGDLGMTTYTNHVSFQRGPRKTHRGFHLGRSWAKNMGKHLGFHRGKHT